jgi:hypothetical protein
MLFRLGHAGHLRPWQLSYNRSDSARSPSGGFDLTQAFTARFAYIPFYFLHLISQTPHPEKVGPAMLKEIVSIWIFGTE